MCELKKNGKVFTSKFAGTGPSSYEKRIYRAAVSQRLRNTDLCAYDIKATFLNVVCFNYVLVGNVQCHKAAQKRRGI